MNLFAQRLGYVLAWIFLGFFAIVGFWLFFPFICLLAVPQTFLKSWPRKIIAPKQYALPKNHIEETRQKLMNKFPPCENIFGLN